MNRRSFLVQGLAAGALTVVGAPKALPEPAGPPAMPMAEGKGRSAVPAAQLAESLALACSWLTDVAQVKTAKLTTESDGGFLHDSWLGSIRGEYTAATRKWAFFGPVWHTGQTIKSLVLASQALARPDLLEAAKFSAEFIGAARIADRSDPDYGLILAYEERGDVVNTAGILEVCDPLFLLADATGDARYANWAIDSALWVANRSYLGAGRFRDGYSFRQRKWVTPPGLLSCPGSKENRLLFDDATFLKVWKRTGEARMKDIFYATAEGLLAEEEPSGNWIRYWPCNARSRTLHPRRAYWWGLPFVDAYRDSGLARYLACAIRVGDWYINAMRTDGGMFRDTQVNFRTPSFGHETSGICCAMIIWHELALLDDSPRWRAASDQALRYCLRGQFREVRDPNLRGAILEQVRPPDGTDSSPYHLRDLSTIFYAQAVSRMLGRPTALR
jgi:hypothetical protein